MRATKKPQKLYFQLTVNQIIRDMEELVQCQQRQGRYPFSAMIPVGIIKSQPCPASLLAAALLGDITDDLGDAEEPEKGTHLTMKIHHLPFEGNVHFNTHRVFFSKQRNICFSNTLDRSVLRKVTGMEMLFKRCSCSRELLQVFMI